MANVLENVIILRSSDVLKLSEQELDNIVEKFKAKGSVPFYYTVKGSNEKVKLGMVVSLRRAKDKILANIELLDHIDQDIVMECLNRLGKTYITTPRIPYIDKNQCLNDHIAGLKTSLLSSVVWRSPSSMLRVSSSMI